MKAPKNGHINIHKIFGIFVFSKYGIFLRGQRVPSTFRYKPRWCRYAWTWEKGSSTL